MSRSHLVKNAATSALSAAVGRKTCASASQPSRSSRCGQSVGTLTKFERCPHATQSCSRLSSASEQSNSPAHGVSLCSATATTSDSASSGTPLISAYRNP